MQLRKIRKGCEDWIRELRSDLAKADPIRYQGPAYDPYHHHREPRMTVMKNNYPRDYTMDPRD